jgi:hypothetical protein
MSVWFYQYLLRIWVNGTEDETQILIPENITVNPEFLQILVN